MKKNILYQKLSLSLAFIFLSVSFFISGCLNYIQNTSIYPDGSGKMTITYWMKTSEQEFSRVINRIGIFNADSINHEFTSSFIQIENISVYADTTDSTTHAVIKISFQSVDSLNQTRVFRDSHFNFREGASGQKIFSQFISPIATGFGIDGSKFQVSYIYTFSGEIITHNAQSQDKQSLTWQYSLDELGSGKTISVTFRPYKIKETPVWIYALSGIVLLVVIFFLFKKKKD